MEVQHGLILPVGRDAFVIHTMHSGAGHSNRLFPIRRGACLDQYDNIERKMNLPGHLSMELRLLMTAIRFGNASDDP